MVLTNYQIKLKVYFALVALSPCGILKNNLLWFVKIINFNKIRNNSLLKVEIVTKFEKLMKRD